MMWDDESERRAREVQRARDMQRQTDKRLASGGGGGSSIPGCFMTGLVTLMVVFVGVVIL